MPTLTRIDREKITFSNLESQVASDREKSFIDALVHSKSPEMRETLKVRRSLLNLPHFGQKKVLHELKVIS